MLELLVLGLFGGTGAMAINAKKAFGDGGGDSGYQPSYAHQPGYAPQHYPPQADYYPQQQAMTYATGREVRIRRTGNHFYVNAVIDGGSTKALIDTGATGVFISQQWLKAIGWDPRSGNYSYPTNAGGQTIYCHRLTLPSITVEGITAHNVDAMIQPPGSNTPNLIGMSFIRNVDFRISGDELILRG